MRGYPNWHRSQIQVLEFKSSTLLSRTIYYLCCQFIGQNISLSWKFIEISLGKGLIVLNKLNPSQIGDITELKCQTYLIEQGWNVLVPIGNHQKYDLVIEKNGKFYKIQVKHAKSVGETGFVVRTKYDVRDNGRMKKMTYSAEDVDYFMTEFNGKFYMFSIFGTTETKFWTVGTRSSTQKQAKNFRAEDILSTL